MKNNHFDIEIKKMLADLEVPFQGQHWDAMAQRLKETTVPNDSENLSEFDHVISKKVKNFETPFNESNWVALRQRLVANAYLKKWILHTKVFESVTMLLLALTFISVADFSGSSKAFPKKAPRQAPAQRAPIKYNGPIASVESENLKLAEPEMMVVTYITLPTAYHSLCDRQSPVPSVPSLPIFGNPIQYNLGEVASIETADIFAQAKEDKTYLASLKEETQVLPQILPLKSAVNKLGLSVYAVLNADHIQTGRDATYNIDIPDLWSSGYGAGVALSKQLGRHIVKVGVEYQEIKYTPKPIVLISEGDASVGYSGSGTSSVKVVMAKVPVSVGYALVDNRRHHVALNVGFTGGVGTETFRQSAFVVASHTPENESSLKERATLAEQSSAYTNSAPNLGEFITKSDKSRPKLFAFANAGLDYEYKLSKSHSIFAQASYQRQLSKKGIGLPNDKVNSVSVQFGLRAYL